MKPESEKWQTSRTIHLEGCPFCGSDAVFEYEDWESNQEYDGLGRVRCTREDCNAQIKGAYLVTVAKWNNREDVKHDGLLKKRITQLEEALRPFAKWGRYISYENIRRARELMEGVSPPAEQEQEGTAVVLSKEQWKWFRSPEGQAQWREGAKEELSSLCKEMFTGGANIMLETLIKHKFIDEEYADVTREEVWRFINATEN